MKPVYHAKKTFHERRFTDEELQKALGIPEDEMIEQVQAVGDEDSIAWSVLSSTGEDLLKNGD